MGVPALFRWLSRKYPKIISPVIEEECPQELEAIQYSKANPNGEVDNLYLDMNGIVHPCSHPEHKPPPETEDEMFIDIFRYTDRVLLMARPRKVLVIAVDGVAPRAKMNQQRARRFRSAQDAKLADEEKHKQILELESRGEVIDNAIKGKKSWDTNAITPGTPFMDRLAEALRYWVAYKLSYDPGWAQLQVIISDATVPGEGEHKLMSFIRSQRSDPEYDPNTKHCIYGLDADLIFLGLATHEPHFRVLREDVFAQQNRSLKISDHLSMTDDKRELLAEQDKKKPFLWLHVNVLREYLEIELHNPQTSFGFDLERAIDDWVFMCFFVGNDFLPHLPSLDVRDNGIDILVNCWKRVLPRLKGYITCDGNLDLESVQILMEALALKEDEIFRKRREGELRREENAKRRRIAQEEEKTLKRQYLSTVSKGRDKAPLIADETMALLDTSGSIVPGFANLSNKDIVNNRDIITKANMANNDAATALKNLLDSKSSQKEDKQNKESNHLERAKDTVYENTTDTSTASNDKKRSLDTTGTSSESSDEIFDEVRMWEQGYHKRYYESKFNTHSDEEIEKIRSDMVKCYLEGISWVLLYYYQGCPSWQWYYPYHYAPFASDFTNVEEIIGEGGIKFKVGQPFRPFEQLMSVLPAASSHNLPEVFRALMSSPESEIIDFYPEEFKIDMNGAKMSWQGIALLPFIEEERLLKAVQGKYDLLTDEELDRNTLKKDVVLISHSNKNYERFYNSLYEKSQNQFTFKCGKTGLAGEIQKIGSFIPDGKTKFPLSQGQMPDLNNSDFFYATFVMPARKKGKSMLLNGYISHNKCLTMEDRNLLLYGQNRNQYSRFRSPNDNRNYINNGPCGREEYLMYSMRRGGYRSFLEFKKDNQAYSHNINQAQSFNQQSQFNGQGGSFQSSSFGDNRNRGYSHSINKYPSKPFVDYQNYGNHGNYGNTRVSNNYSNYNNDYKSYNNYNNYKNSYNNYNNHYSNNYNNQGNYSNYGNSGVYNQHNSHNPHKPGSYNGRNKFGRERPAGRSSSYGMGFGGAATSHEQNLPLASFNEARSEPTINKSISQNQSELSDQSPMDAKNLSEKQNYSARYNR